LIRRHGHVIVRIYFGFTTFIDTVQINAAQKKNDELSRARDQTQARLAVLEGQPEQPGSPAALRSAPDDTAGVKDRADRLQRLGHAALSFSSVFTVIHRENGKAQEAHTCRGAARRGQRLRARRRLGPLGPGPRPAGGRLGMVAAEPPKCGRDRPPGSQSKPKVS
jgi:hypothetical protein